MDESLVKYLAGLLDADGSLSFSFRCDQNREDRCFVGLVMKLAASDAVDPKGFVDTLPALTGFGRVHREGRNNQFKNWTVSRRAELEMLLPRLVKHMVIKAKHWQWLLDTWREMRGGYGDNACTFAKRDELSEASKKSRRENVGPLKPKNHPTWAWLAGYLDGDGCYSYRRYEQKGGYQQWHINVSAVAHRNDISVLEFLQKAFGGMIVGQGQSDDVMLWKRSLGYQNRSFALEFLPNLVNHSRLKRHKIEAIISHHQQRLSVPGVERRSCSVDGCYDPAHGHGLCSKHYQRARKAQATV